MSDQTWPPKTPDGDGDAVPPESPADPTATDPYSAAPFTPEPQEPAGGYPPPPPAPEPGPYSPSPVDPYGQSPAAGYQTPYPQSSGPYSQPQPPDPYAQPQPADPYTQPPGGYGQPGPYSQPTPPAQPGPYSQPTPPVQPGGQYPQPGYPAQPPYSGPVAGPVPTTFNGAVLVDWPKRALGGLIDYVAAGLVIGFVVGIVSNISSGLGSIVSFVLGVGWWAFLGYKSGTTGVTLGRSIAKTKLVSEATGQPIGVANGIVRQLAHIIDTIICYIGWLFPLWDAKRQTIADKLLKTVVIDNSGDPNAGNFDWSVNLNQR